MEQLQQFNDAYSLPQARNMQEAINNIVTRGLLQTFKQYCNDNQNNKER